MSFGPERRELELLRKYAHEATKAITALAGGGSELFAGKIGDLYMADLPFCMNKIRERETKTRELLTAAIRKAKEVTS